MRIHAHHIVPKGVWRGEAGEYVSRAQAVLSKYADVTYDKRNLTWALWWDHGTAKAVAEALEQADAAGGGDAVFETLELIAEILSKGQKFRGIGQ